MRVHRVENKLLTDLRVSLAVRVHRVENKLLTDLRVCLVVIIHRDGKEVSY